MIVHLIDSSLLSKPVIFTKSTISFLLAEFPRLNLAVKFSDANLLNSWVAILLSWPSSVVTLFSISLIFVLWSDFLTNLLTLGILFLTAVRAVVLAKKVVLGILILTSFV